MKEISDAVMQDVEDTAVQGLRAIRAFFAYEGDRPHVLQRAKIGAATIGAYSRLRASETNRMAVELAAKRIDLPLPPAPALPEKRVGK